MRRMSDYQKPQIVFIGKNEKLLEYLASRRDITVAAAYFPQDEETAPLLVTVCELRKIPYLCVSSRADIYTHLRFQKHAALGIQEPLMELTHEVLNHPKHGFVTICAGLLSQAAHSQWGYLLTPDGAESGVTIYREILAKQTCEILLEHSFPVAFDDIAEDLKVKMDRELMKLLDRELSNLVNGGVRVLSEVALQKKNLSNLPGGTFSWDDEPNQIYNLIRFKSRAGGCSVLYEGQIISILWGWLDVCLGAPDNAAPGTVVYTTQDYFKVALRHGKFLRVTRWSPSHKILSIGSVLQKYPA